MMTRVTETTIDELTPDERNANRGTQRGLRVLDDSLRQYGAGRSILVDRKGRIIAGNKTAERAADLGLEDVIIVETDGNQLVAVKRTDLDLENGDDRARLMAYADNRSGQLDLDFDPEVIAADLDLGLDLSSLWTDLELEELQLEAESETDDGNYSRKIEAPAYEPSGDKPQIESLFDDSKTRGLVEAIDCAEELSEDERAFLRVAAQRHTVLNFKLIADYYAHSDVEVQALMEDSALVIIDFDKAISQGYVELTEKIREMVRDEYGDD